MNEPTLIKHSRNFQNQLRFSSKSTKYEKFSLLLLGSSEFCHLLSECIHTINKGTRKVELTVVKAESVESILRSSSPVHVDFIALLMNTGQRHCIEQVERDICNIEPTYLCDKIILVNGNNNLTPSSMGLSFDELSNLKEKYRLHLLNGNIKDENSCARLARQILNFMFTVCGIKTGMPIVLHFNADKYPVD